MMIKEKMTISYGGSYDMRQGQQSESPPKPGHKIFCKIFDCSFYYFEFRRRVESFDVEREDCKFFIGDVEGFQFRFQVCRFDDCFLVS